MYWVFMILYVVLFIVQLIYLVKAIKNKDNNKDWISLLGMIIGSILSCVLISIYEVINSQSTYLDGIVVLLFSACALLVYGCITALSIVLKLFRKCRLKRKGIVREKTDKKIKREILLKMILSIVCISICLCFVDFLVYEYKEIAEKDRYVTVKEEKIAQMVNYLNDKYDADYTVEDNVFYREYDYDEVELELNPKKYDDSYIGIFDNGKETITTSVNKEFLSDNAQLEDISYLIRDYYSDVTGVDIEYVVIKNEDGKYEDDLINNTLQFKFNDVITKDNIEDFINELLNNNIEMIFYIKDSSNREKILEKMIDKLSYLEKKDNIKGLAIYLYDSKEELIVKRNNIMLQGDYRHDEVHLDYYASNMFGFIYVPNSIEFSEEFDKENTFVSIAFSNKKYPHGDKYKDKDTKTIKDWTVYDFK